MNNHIGQDDLPESSRPSDSNQVDKPKTNTDIRCTCRRLLAKQTADRAGVEVQCPRCKRTWTFQLGPS